MKKVDYEQLYYDQLYKNRKMIKELEELKIENQVYKEMLKRDSLKTIIAKSIIDYRKGKSDKDA